eukprot:8982937-Pyramimonas_sp.AAC.1
MLGTLRPVELLSMAGAGASDKHLARRLVARGHGCRRRTQRPHRAVLHAVRPSGAVYDWSAR